MLQISWGKTQKNKTLLIIDGHEFTHKLNTKTTTHWKCAKWRSHIIASTLLDIQDDTAVQLSLPNRDSMNRTLNRHKQKENKEIVTISDSSHFTQIKLVFVFQYYIRSGSTLQLYHYNPKLL